MADTLLPNIAVASTLPTGANLVVSRPGTTSGSLIFGLVAPAAVAPVTSVNGQTGAVTVAAGVSSFQTRTGAITLTSADITGTLGFTPYSAANPAGYLTASTGVTSVNGQVGAVTISASGTYSLPAATTTVRGGVVVGAGLSISTDVLSLGAATATVRGGVRIGATAGTCTGLVSPT